MNFRDILRNAEDTIRSPKFRNMMRNAGNTMKREALDLLAQGVYSPVKSQAVSELSAFTTTIGNFVIEKIKGKYQRAVSLYINEANKWMDEAFHIILRKYNNLEKDSNSLIMTTSVSNKENTYYQLAPGTHVLKYRDFTIMVAVDEPSSSSVFSDPTRNSAQRTYMIATFDLSDRFPKQFNTDMLKYRNILLKIDPDSPYVNVYSNTVSQYSDTYSAWSFANRIPKKPVDDLYIPWADKVRLFTELNTFFASQQDYRDRGITPNFVMVLYGPPGSGKDSVARTIASAYNRNLYLPTLGNGGKFIPRSIEANADNLNISSPMFLISDIDKFPYLINEQPWVDTKNNPDDIVRKRIQDNIMVSKQLYNRMINALDGIMTGDGWIIVMTTNNIDAFSKTFLRDGRVDLCMEIGYVTPEVFRTFVFRNYGIALPSDIKLKSKELVMSTLIADQLYRKMKGDEFIAKYVKEKK